jgi:hypothetical protein
MVGDHLRGAAMSDKSDFWGPDPAVYAANKNKFTDEQLQPYFGKWVAWSLDGTRILAACPVGGDLDAALRAAGLDPQQAVYSYVDDPDECDGYL